MGRPFFHALLLLLTCLACARGGVVISEIMYHSLSEDSREEWVEIHNTSAAPVSLDGWRLSGGADFDFPNGTVLPAGGHLVVAADLPVFTALHPAVANVLGAYTGSLANSGETLRLRNPAGVITCEVRYADDGDWGERRRDDPADHGHRGWRWYSAADGGGSSLELIHAGFDPSEGQNWATSSTPGGTPGAANSVAATNIAPILDQVTHFPLAPKSTEPVTVLARVRDDVAAAAAVLHWRLDGTPSFTAVAMSDDGANGDALPGDGIFGAEIPAQASGAIVEFYISATDGTAARTWPAPARELDGTPLQTQNCLYVVDDAAYLGAVPIYRVVMRAADAAELAQINADTGTPPFPFNPGEPADQTHSHARFNATFISVDGSGAKVRYLTGVRNRGNGSRTATPPNYNVHFTNDDRWNDRAALELNSQNTPYQLLGSTLFRKAGLPGAESRAVKLRINSTDPTGGSTAAPTHGFYACNEFRDADFTEHHFPNDGGGNVYRAQRFLDGLTPGLTALKGGNLGLIVPGASETLSLPELYAINYRKTTNVSRNDWSDLIALTTALAKGQSGATLADPVTWDPDYATAVGAATDVRQWMRWLAVSAMLDNEETNLSNGDGDDYHLYFGGISGRARLLHHDLDTILGRSAGANSATHGIFRMCDDPDGLPTPLNAFIKHPEFAPLYYEELRRLLDGIFLPANFDDVCDQMLATHVAPAVRTAIKTFNSARHAHITGLVPRTLTVTAVRALDGTTLAPVTGFPQTTDDQCQLEGRAPAVETRSVKVNGVPAVWSAWEAKWTTPAVALSPGVNRVLIQAFDTTNAEIARTFQSVWFFDGTEETRTGGPIASETWSAASGPYRVTDDFTVPAGMTLTIEPGTVVFFNAGASLTIANGAILLANGTANAPIRLMPAPGGAAWDGLVFQGSPTSPQSFISHALIEGNNLAAITATAADLVLDHVSFGTTNRQYLTLNGASLLADGCIFPNATSAFEMVTGTGGIRAGGRGIFRGCFFGKTIGYNDVVDLAGAQRPGPAWHFVDNVFTGSGDDILDLDSTDAWIERNIFLGVHRNGSPDPSAAIACGTDGAGNSDITIIGNLFADLDHAISATNGNFLTFLNNTVVDQNRRTSEDTASAVFNFSEGGGAALGLYAEGNIIHSAEALVRNYAAASSTVTLNNNLLPLAWAGPGAGNIFTSPLLANAAPAIVPTANDYPSAAAKLRAAFTPLATSPARGTGPNGTDIGGIRTPGLSLGGAPTGTTSATSATLTTGTLMTGNGTPTGATRFPTGSGWTHFKWRLDGGAWSTELPTGTNIALTALADGVHTIEALGKMDTGVWQDELGFAPAAVLWTVDTNAPSQPESPVRISEVLASNVETLVFNGVAPDFIELHNPAATSADISGWGISDTAALPYKYTLPAGTVLAPGARLLLHASSTATVPQPRTGFSIKVEGDTIRLTRSAAMGGGIADSISFGHQLADYSVGRAPNGAWALCKPTPGTPNVLAETAQPGSVVINEWLAAAAVLANDDFIELHNRALYPTDIGLHYLTDNPADWPDRHLIRQHTFIEPGGYLSFKADGESGDGPDHVNFNLSSLQGEVALVSPTLELLDTIVYGPQRADVSEGLTPNGAGAVASFNQPTPGGPNPAVVGTTYSTTALVIAATHIWKSHISSTAAPPLVGGLDFTAPGYDDSAWTDSAQQLFFIETAALNNADGFVKATVLPGITTTRPYQTYYFRTAFYYTGPMTDITLTARILCDDGANIYLNGGTPTPLRMNAGATAYSDRANSSVGDATVQTITLPATNLVQGLNTVAVSVHQANNQTGGSPSSDIVFGMKLEITQTAEFPNVPVILNEVLPLNASLQNPDGSYAGWVELINPAPVPMDISDMSLSNDLAVQRKFIFPAGTVLAPGARHIIQCNPLTPQSPVNTGWALSGTGGVLAFYHTPANATALHDSIAYGRQLPDFALARVPDGSGAWTLAVPSRDAQNAAAAVAQANFVKLNEWTANGADWFELYNLATAPVDIGGNYFTDSLTNKTKFPIPPLTFLGADGSTRWQTWSAPGTSGNTGSVNFSIEPGEALGFFNAAGTALDTTPAIAAQAAGQSAGRYPEGASNVLVLIPTPGTANTPPAADGDNDGMPDAWELAHSLNPADAADAGLDADGDGQTNLAEFIAGTNPRAVGDAFKASLDLGGPSGPVIRFLGIAGKTYTVQFKTALSDPAWQRVGDAAPQVTGLVEIPDPAGTGAGQRFYRIVTPAVP